MVTVDSDPGRTILRHSTAHVLAQAVVDLWPGAHYAIGPAITDGFYYDFALPGGATFSDDDLERIAARMRAIMAEDQPFVRQEFSIDDGLALFADQPFKREIITGVSADAALQEEAAADIAPGAAVVSTYRNTDTFVDLCRGPHVPSTGRLGHFALLRVAGAYWRGDEKRPQLQRIYGTAWESEKALAEHLVRLEEAERRDHRRLGAELDLFSFPSEIGSGLAVFHPKGAAIRRLMEDYSRQRHEDGGYQFVYTPAHHQGRSLRDLGPSAVVRRGHVPPHGARRGPALLPEAHELPDAHPHLPQPATLVPRVAHAALRVRDGLPLREVGGGPRSHPGARSHHGRLPHLLRPRPDGRGARFAAHLRPRRAARLRAGRLLPGVVDPARGQGHRYRRGLARRHRGAAGGGHRARAWSW